MLLRAVSSLEEITCIRNWKPTVRCLLRLPNSFLTEGKVDDAHSRHCLSNGNLCTCGWTRCETGASDTQTLETGGSVRGSRIIDFALANCLRSNLKHPSVITQYQGAHLTQHVGQWWLEQSASGAAATASPVCVPCPSQQYLGTADALFRNVQRLDPNTQYVLVL